MARADSDAAFERFALSESRNVLRDCLGKTGEIDVERPPIPFLFIGAEEDEIIPSALVDRNSEAYTAESSRSDFIEFSGRGHFICGQEGWQDVAAYIANWLDEVAAVRAAPAA